MRKLEEIGNLDHSLGRTSQLKASQVRPKCRIFLGCVASASLPPIPVVPYRINTNRDISTSHYDSSGRRKPDSLTNQRSGPATEPSSSRATTRLPNPLHTSCRATVGTPSCKLIVIVSHHRFWWLDLIPVFRQAQSPNSDQRVGTQRAIDTLAQGRFPSATGGFDPGIGSSSGRLPLADDH
jgi:hypothetical protein